MQNRIAVESSQLFSPRPAGRLQLLQPIKITAEQGVENETLTPQDLTQFSNFLAREMSYKPFHASYEPASWYREQVGADICSEAQSSLLRTMTIKRCNEGAGKSDEDPRAPSAWSEAADAFSVMALLVALFIVAGLFGRA